MTQAIQETTARCNPNKVKTGSVFSRHSHGVVVAARGERYTLRNEQGFEWEVAGSNILEAEFSFADQYDSNSKESRSRIIEILKEHGHTAMTIIFRKKPDPKEIAKELAKGQGSMSVRAWNTKVKELMQGERRVMQGYHTNKFDEHQRLKFIESGKGPRLVDPRTIEELVVAKQRFEVK